MIDSILDTKLSAQIVEKIQARIYLFHQKTKAFEEICYAPYMFIRRKYNLTGFVLSGFAPNYFRVDNGSIQDIYYGLNKQLAQPEIHTSETIIQIYSNGSRLNSRIIRERCACYNQDFLQKPVFVLVVFTTNSKYRLTKIEALLPDKNGRIVERKELFCKDATVQLAI